MLHAKTAVADGQWARVGSSNLNIASWLGNREIDVAVENTAFAGQLAAQYERDLQNATEIVLAPRRRRQGDQVRSSQARPPRVRRGSGSSGRAAAGALRLANSVGAALAHHRVLGETSGGSLLAGTLMLSAMAVIAVLWPASIAWPFALLAAWFALNLGIRHWRQRRRAHRPAQNVADD